VVLTVVLLIFTNTQPVWSHLVRVIRTRVDLPEHIRSLIYSIDMPACTCKVCGEDQEKQLLEERRNKIVESCTNLSKTFQDTIDNEAIRFFIDSINEKCIRDVELVDDKWRDVSDKIPCTRPWFDQAGFTKIHLPDPAGPDER